MSLRSFIDFSSFCIGERNPHPLIIYHPYFTEYQGEQKATKQTENGTKRKYLLTFSFFTYKIYREEHFEGGE
jgi:hypothetical protein